MNNAEKEELAFQLIDIVQVALTELNGGASVFPTKWKKYISQKFSFHKRGAKPSMKQRDIEIAEKAIDYKLSVKSWIESGNKIESKDTYNQYLEKKLTEEYNLDKRQITRIIEKNEKEALYIVSQKAKFFGWFLSGLAISQGKKPESFCKELIDQIPTKKPFTDSLIEWAEAYRASLKSQ